MSVSFEKLDSSDYGWKLNKAKCIMPTIRPLDSVKKLIRCGDYTVGFQWMGPSIPKEDNMEKLSLFHLCNFVSTASLPGCTDEDTRQYTDKKVREEMVKLSKLDLVEFLYSLRGPFKPLLLECYEMEKWSELKLHQYLHALRYGRSKFGADLVRPEEGEEMLSIPDSLSDEEKLSMSDAWSPLYDPSLHGYNEEMEEKLSKMDKMDLIQFIYNDMEKLSKLDLLRLIYVHNKDKELKNLSMLDLLKVIYAKKVKLLTPTIPPPPEVTPEPSLDTVPASIPKEDNKAEKLPKKKKLKLVKKRTSRSILQSTFIGPPGVLPFGIADFFDKEEEEEEEYAADDFPDPEDSDFSQRLSELSIQHYNRLHWNQTIKFVKVLRMSKVAGTGGLFSVTFDARDSNDQVEAYVGMVQKDKGYYPIVFTCYEVPKPISASEFQQMMQARRQARRQEMIKEDMLAREAYG